MQKIYIMPSINLLKLRRSLPHGSMVRIAEATSLSAKVVGEVLNYGWHIHLRNQVCDAALSILDETNVSSDVIEHAKEHGLVSAHSIHVPGMNRKKKSTPNEADEDFTWDDLSEWTWDDMVEFIEDEECDIDVSEFEGGILSGNDEEGLREALADDIGIDFPSYEDEN